MSGFSRRRFLAGTASTGLAAVSGMTLSGCSDDSTSSKSANTSPSTTIKRGSIRDVEHVVILMQENRSFDHYFGTRKGVRGFSDPDVIKRPDGRPIWIQDLAGGGVVTPYHLDSKTTKGACGPDPAHDWSAQHHYYNNGAMDAFAYVGPHGMGYFTADDLPFHHALADRFTLCDSYHCSVIGPTLPNRHYSMTGTIDAEGKFGGPANDNRLGPFGWETYPERLTKAGISWRLYQETDDFGDAVLELYSAFQNIPTTHPLYEAGVQTRSRDAFMKDVANDNLPQVSWIVAPTLESEHPFGGPPMQGGAYVAETLAALMANEKVWAKTVFILNYDENGGYFDHVVPPVAPKGTPGEWIGEEPIGLGLRVPAIVISPWSRGGKVNSTVFDHTSTLQFLETRFGVEIPNISDWRRETCGDLSTLLDFDHYDPSIPDLPTVESMKALATKAIADCKVLPAVVPPTPPLLPDGTPVD